MRQSDVTQTRLQTFLNSILKMKFYKGVLVTDLKPGYIPGTVTTVFNEALMWKERISGKKAKGASKHVRHGQSVIIEITYTGEVFGSRTLSKRRCS